MGAVAVGGLSAGAHASDPALRDAWRAKVPAWAALVAALVALNYAGNLSSGDDDGSEPLYQWSTAIAGAIFFAFIGGLTLLIARRPAAREALGLRPPRSWGKAAGLILAGLIAVYAAGAVFGALGLEAGEEQGLVPDEWRSGVAGAYAANFVVVALFGPVVEELLFRGVGYTALHAAFGSVAAVVVTAAAFGLVHGLLVALPALLVVGLALGLLRWATDSVYPCIVLHVAFNGIALAVAPFA